MRDHSRASALALDQRPALLRRPPLSLMGPSTAVWSRKSPALSSPIFSLEIGSVKQCLSRDVASVPVLGAPSYMLDCSAPRRRVRARCILRPPHRYDPSQLPSPYDLTPPSAVLGPPLRSPETGGTNQYVLRDTASIVVLAARNTTCSSSAMLCGDMLGEHAPTHRSRPMLTWLRTA